MAPKVSALSAAIATGVPTATAPVAKKGLVLDPATYPCLKFAEAYEKENGQGPVTDPNAKYEGVDLTPEQMIPVGSLPTTTIMEGIPLANYELNPRRRAGGEEMPPESMPIGSLSRAGSMAGSLASNFISDALIGSLPKGMTDTQKKKIQQSVPMSPSMSMMKDMSMSEVTQRTAEGKKLRRSVLRGAVVVYITAGYSGKRFIFERAKALGVKSIVLDGPDSWAQLLEKEGVIEKFVGIDFSNAETVLDRCYEAIKAAVKNVGELDGICTFCEMAVPLASRLAEKLGLPHNSVQAVDNARDKHNTRSIMEKEGLPTPKHFRITTDEDVSKAAAHVGFPSVIKPVSGAASIGVIRVNNEEDLWKAYKKVAHDMKRAKVVAGALVEGYEDDEEGGDAGGWTALVLMLEEYLDGDEVDCDVIFDNGQCVFGAVADNWPTIEPYFNETGSNSPSTLSRSKQAELLELAIRAVQCLGFILGVFHVECKYTSRGPRLIEVNCRMGGGPIRDINLLTWGVDLVEEHLMSVCGIPVRPPIAQMPLKQMAEYSVNADKSGVLQNIDFIDQWKDHPDVLYIKPYIQPGAKCTCVEDGLPTWVYCIMVAKSTLDESIAFVKHITETTVLPIS